MNKQIIELNGKKYDAITGELIDTAAQKAKPASVKTEVKIAAPVKTTTGRTPKPSQTLMRKAVKKPAKASSIKVSSAIQNNSTRPALVKKPSVTTISHARKERAASTIKSEKISRFAYVQPKSTKPKLEHVPVKLAPEPPAKPPTGGAPDPRPSNEPIADMFSRAIANATHYVDIKAHTAKRKRKAKNHLASMAAGFAALALIAGFATYLNSPSLQIELAGLRAGVSTKDPNFKNTTFALTSVTSEGGKRVIALKADTGANYQLIEQSTNWSGEQMIASISSKAANGRPNYRVTSVGNQTVYLLDNGNATWVKDGTWYQLNGVNPANDQQLRELVPNV